MRHLTLAVLFSLFGSVGLASGAIAQTNASEDLDPTPQSIGVPFEGEVVFACNFDPPTSGRLVPVGTPPIAEVLTSLEPGGEPGQVDVRCNAESNLIVNAPVQTDGPPVSTTDEEAWVTSPSGDTCSSSCLPLRLPSGQIVPLTVDMSVRAEDVTTGFPPGRYRYTVTLVVIP